MISVIATSLSVIVDAIVYPLKGKDRVTMDIQQEGLVECGKRRKPSVHTAILLEDSNETALRSYTKHSTVLDQDDQSHVKKEEFA